MKNKNVRKREREREKVTIKPDNFLSRLLLHCEKKGEGREKSGENSGGGAIAVCRAEMQSHFHGRVFSKSETRFRTSDDLNTGGHSSRRLETFAIFT